MTKTKESREFLISELINEIMHASSLNKEDVGSFLFSIACEVFVYERCGIDLLTNKLELLKNDPALKVFLEQPLKGGKSIQQKIAEDICK